MSVPVRLAAVAGAVVLSFAAAFGVGAAVGPQGADDPAGAEPMHEGEGGGHDDA